MPAPSFSKRLRGAVGAKTFSSAPAESESEAPRPYHVKKTWQSLGNDDVIPLIATRDRATLNVARHRTDFLLFGETLHT